LITDDRRAATALAARVGHPGELFDAIQGAIQIGDATSFAEISADLLQLMWSVDAYRSEGIVPLGMGDPSVEPADRLAAIARSKGNWFATVLSLLLQNRTSQVIRPRVRVEGFSQWHQVDLAWPHRHFDPLVCIETKVTGGPAYGTRPSRGAMSDWTNRRKELKFAATDLKLYRRQSGTQIRHWGVWRQNASPKTYFLWGARLRPSARRSPGDSIEKMVTELRALTDTYLDGAGLLPWRINEAGDGYELVPMPRGAAVASIDDMLDRIDSEIRNLVLPDGSVPPPQVPGNRQVDLSELELEEDSPSESLS
jgi:hypothetical protein